MGSRFTRRRFLTAASAGAAYLVLIPTVGCEPPERSSKVRSSRTPRVKPLPGAPFPPDGVWAFRSRPDLNPPAVAVAKEAHDETAPGYIFVAPEKGGAGKGGSMIIDDRGQVVWFHPLRGPYGRTMNFETQVYQGRNVLTWGQTPGQYVIFDASYREIASFGAANGYNGDHHEFLISPQDTALISIYNAVPRDLSSVGGSTDSVAIQGIVQELDIQTGEVLFEWRSIDHVALEETYVTPIEDHYPGIDYFHI
ncbi:MAG: arylsulfotransferase family protein, partial [Rubrobacter sp.]